MSQERPGATPGSLTVSRIAEIRKVSRKGWAGSEMTVNEWNELLTLAQDALRMRSAVTPTTEAPLICSHCGELFDALDREQTAKGTVAQSNDEAEEAIYTLEDELGLALTLDELARCLDAVAALKVAIRDRVYTKADAEAMCEIAKATALKSRSAVSATRHSDALRMIGLEARDTSLLNAVLRALELPECKGEFVPKKDSYTNRWACECGSNLSDCPRRAPLKDES